MDGDWTGGRATDHESGAPLCGNRASKTSRSARVGGTHGTDSLLKGQRTISPGEASAGECTGEPLNGIPGADTVPNVKGYTHGHAICERPDDPAWSQTLACADASCTATGRSHGRPAALITCAALVRIAASLAHVPITLRDRVGRSWQCGTVSRTLRSIVGGAKPR